MVRTGEGRVPHKLTPPKRRIRARSRDLIKALALRLGISIRRVPPGRHGDPFADQVNLLGAMNVRRVLDVGAYGGETTLIYRKLFPNSEIHCFEPVSESFARLTQAIAGNSGIVPNRLAVGDTSGPVQLYVNRFAATSSRLPPARLVDQILPPELLDAVGTDSADSTTVDDYCRQRGIDRVDILKLDIQGGELAALRGAGRMLAERRISLVYTEVLVDTLYEGQGTAGEILRALESHEYRLYGLYNLVYGRDTSLYQMDALLVSPQVDVRGSRGLNSLGCL